MSKETDREEILQLVKKYYTNHHRTKTYTEGDRIAYASRVYDEEEMCILVDSALEFWLTSGRYTSEFENNFAEYLGVKYCSLVNSGSSANLLAFMTLTSPLLGERAIQRGDEVITVAAGFPTTISPIIQFGAVPVFVDVTIPEYNIDINMLEEALSKKTKAVMIAHTLGNPFDIKSVKEFCKKNNLWLVEDNCDALGSECLSRYGEKKEYKKTGTFGDIGTSSFYPPHHMTMGEGGAVYTDNPVLHKIIRSMRDWGRDCSCPSGADNLCGHRFENKFGELPRGYDHKYVYSHFGYNLKATDMQAAIGCAQLKKLPGFTKRRRENFNLLYDGLRDLEDSIILPRALKDSRPSWFGFIMTCKKSGVRDKIVSFIENKNIQSRMLFAGNMIKHPCFDSLRNDKDKYRTIGELPVSNRIMNDSFWIGVYPGMQPVMIDYMIQSIHTFFRDH